MALPQTPGTLNMSAMLEKLAAAQLATEWRVVMKVIEKLTGRFFTSEDDDKTKRVFDRGVLDKYTLTYDGQKLGTISYINSWFEFAVKFEPLK